MHIGVTGSEGFIGSHLALHLRAQGDTVLPCPRTAWDDPGALAVWAEGCDAIVHLAGQSRNPDGEALYRVNVGLTEKLTAALRQVRHPVRCCLGSTTHEARELPYHASKRESRRLLEAWAGATGNACTTLLMANAFGPAARPFFNSVVSTFCYLAAKGRTPETIHADAELALIWIGDLVREIGAILHEPSSGVTARVIAARAHPKLGELWNLLQSFRALPPGAVPPLPDAFTAELWITFSSYR